MASGKNPLILMMALAMPGASQALGLGDMRVDSALNERLVAEIDIVGATATELSELRAAVANRETFLRYGADRPAFLASAVFKVAQDRQGRPVLAVRSAEAFTEPLVNFLVDLSWHNGELVREYSLLLDPPQLAQPSKLAAASAASHTPPAALDVPAGRIDPPREQPKPSSRARNARKMTHVKVGAKATLRGIAWRVGERSNSDLEKMMLAVFRANPGAFDGNINRLHRGAVLIIPSHAQVAAIPKAEAQREIHAQMAAWRHIATTATPPGILLTASTAAPVAPETLDTRLKTLEHQLIEVNSILQSQNQKLVELRQQAAQAEQPPHPAPQNNVYARRAPLVAASAPLQAPPTHSRLVPILGGIGLLASALAGVYFGLRRRVSKPTVSLAAADADAHAHSDAVEPPIPAIAPVETVNPLQAGAPPVDVTRVEEVRLDYNLVDLDMTAQYVNMPSALNEQAVVKERRSNLADVLRLAIEREPDRHDLRMKLLELYYSAAATNRRGFLDVVQNLARDHGHMQADEWEKIAFMGRQIAAENPLFAREEQDGDDELANCA
ncbi:MAG: hypothetical protein M3N50_08930 [Pseudomonadota bacterium]|nr:hypothetical protein [Pseudomonadota bacterium]